MNETHGHDLSLLITHQHDDLHVLLCGFVVFVEVSGVKSQVDVVTDVTRHYNLGEAQFPCDHGAPVHQVWIFLSDLDDITHQSFHGDPQACVTEDTHSFTELCIVLAGHTLKQILVLYGIITVSLYIDKAIKTLKS